MRCRQPLILLAVNETDLTALLAPGVDIADGREQLWADLGAGEGAFTLALAGLLGPGGHITAVDRDRRALEHLGEDMARRFPSTQLSVQVADFTKALSLRELNGIVMANSLHFVRDKGPVLDAVRAMLRPRGRLILVEYGTDRSNAWVPHPMSFRTWTKVAAEAGFTAGVPARQAREGAVQLHTVPSRYFGAMYSALSRRPER